MRPERGPRERGHSYLQERTVVRDERLCREDHLVQRETRLVCKP